VSAFTFISIPNRRAYRIDDRHEPFPAEGVDQPGVHLDHLPHVAEVHGLLAISYPPGPGPSSCNQGVRLAPGHPYGLQTGLRRDTTTRSLMRESTDLAICNVTSSCYAQPGHLLDRQPARFISSVISGPPP
jgi:hypothetical protein